MQRVIRNVSVRNGRAFVMATSKICPLNPNPITLTATSSPRFTLLAQPLRPFSSCDDHRGPADIAAQIQGKLAAQFKEEFDHVEVKNDDGVGQHVRIFVVSDQFEGKLPIARHRMINELIKEEIKGVHACSIEAKTLK